MDGSEFRLLPLELHVCILQKLPLADLVKLREVSRHFRDVVDHTPILWLTASLENVMPKITKKKLVEKAASFGNIEAMIKLGVMYLYSSGRKDAGTVKGDNVEKALNLFLRAEEATPDFPPFTPVFYRPPWAEGTVQGFKETMFHELRKMAAQGSSQTSRWVYSCLTELYPVLNDRYHGEYEEWVQSGITRGCGFCKCDDAINKPVPSITLQEKIRVLRQVVSKYPNYVRAQNALLTCHIHNTTNPEMARKFVRDFFQHSRPSRTAEIFGLNSKLTPGMRNTLNDWLFEVTTVKAFDYLVFHNAVRIVDRYLLRRQCEGAKMQLLGITSLVLITRCMEYSVLPIREAAWLTDSAYRYDDIVDMLGEIVACLHGNIRTLTIADYANALATVINLSSIEQDAHRFYCDLTLWHPILGNYPTGLVATAATFLAQTVHGKPDLLRLSLVTGYSKDDILGCTLAIYTLCFNEGAADLDPKLTALKQRYSSYTSHSVYSIRVPNLEDLYQRIDINVNFYKVYMRSFLEDCDRPGAVCTYYYEKVQSLKTRLRNMELFPLNDVSLGSVQSGYAGDLSSELTIFEEPSSEFRDETEEDEDDMTPDLAEKDLFSPKPEVEDDENTLTCREIEEDDIENLTPPILVAPSIESKRKQSDCSASGGCLTNDPSPATSSSKKLRLIDTDQSTNSELSVFKNLSVVASTSTPAVPSSFSGLFPAFSPIQESPQIRVRVASPDSISKSRLAGSSSNNSLTSPTFIQRFRKTITPLQSLDQVQPPSSAAPLMQCDPNVQSTPKTSRKRGGFRRRSNEGKENSGR